MGKIETYRSACHALNLALQAYRDFETALEVTGALWDLRPPEGMYQADVLHAMLCEAGLNARLQPSRQRTVREVIQRCAEQRWLTFFLVNLSRRGIEYRWAVVLGHTRKNVHYGVLIQRGDPEDKDPTLIDRTLHPVVAVETVLHGAAVVAEQWIGDDAV